MGQYKYTAVDIGLLQVLRTLFNWNTGWDRFSAYRCLSIDSFCFVKTKERFTLCDWPEFMTGDRVKWFKQLGHFLVF